MYKGTPYTISDGVNDMLLNTCIIWQNCSEK